VAGASVLILFAGLSALRADKPSARD